MNNQPIGVLDSGVGGLTILKEIRRQLPGESTIYIGDSQNAPYGKRTPQEIRNLASQLIQFLLEKDVKLIVVACNTITVNGIDKLRAQFPQVPIIGTVPVVKKAAEVSKNKKIGLLVTEATAKSAYNQNLIDTFAKDCTMVTVGTNKLVPLIEAGQHKLLQEVIANELRPFKEADVDVVILGSTHFPILRDKIAHFMGGRVLILDSGGAVARQVGRVLANNKALGALPEPQHALFTTGDVAPFAEVAGVLFDADVPDVRQVVLQ